MLLRPQFRASERGLAAAHETQCGSDASVLLLYPPQLLAACLRAYLPASLPLAAPGMSGNENAWECRPSNRRGIELFRKPGLRLRSGEGTCALLWPEMRWSTKCVRVRP